jgi:hypothetical protein
MKATVIKAVNVFGLFLVHVAFNRHQQRLGVAGLSHFFTGLVSVGYGKTVILQEMPFREKCFFG